MKLLARGFSLKQLIVVSVIIVVLAALAFPLVSIVRYRTLEARCRANLWAILVKYKSLKEQNNGKADWQELQRWLYRSPESESIRFCPLGREYFLNNTSRIVVQVYDETRGVWVETNPDEVIARQDKSIIAYCYCHTKPIKPGGCNTPFHTMYTKVLAACDEGDGKVEYRFLELEGAVEVNQFVPPDRFFP